MVLAHNTIACSITRSCLSSPADKRSPQAVGLRGCDQSFSMMWYCRNSAMRSWPMRIVSAGFASLLCMR